MPRKSIKFLAIALLALLCMTAITGCSSEEQPTENQTEVPSQGEQPSQGEEQTSVIKSLTAKEETVVARVAENKSLTAFYTLTGFKSLSAAQKKCTYISSDESIVKISGTMFKALKPGTATITVKVKGKGVLKCAVTVKTDPQLTGNKNSNKEIKKISLKQGRTKTVLIKGKATDISNKYMSTKIAEIKGSAGNNKFTVKALKKGTTTLKIKVNDSKVLKLKVVVRK